MGTGTEARVPGAGTSGSRSAGKPQAEPFTPPGPLPAAAVEGIEAVPPGEAAPVTAADAAPEAAEATASPLSKADPEDALGNPEPAPTAASSVPANPKYAGGPDLIPRTNPNGGHLPADFDLHTISDNPQEHRLFQQALKNKAASTSPKPNAYQRYIQAIGKGETPTYAQANEAWSTIQQEYFKLSRNAGINMDGVQIHHWNYNKGDFPLQVTDPRNLVQTPDRQTSWNSHQALNEATSSDPNTAIGKWKGPIDAIHVDAIHELSITPTPPPPAVAPVPPAAPDLNP